MKQSEEQKAQAIIRKKEETIGCLQKIWEEDSERFEKQMELLRKQAEQSERNQNDHHEAKLQVRACSGGNAPIANKLIPVFHSCRSSESSCTG